MNKFDKKVTSEAIKHKKKCDEASSFYKSKYGIIVKEFSFRQSRRVTRRILKGTNTLENALLNKYN